MTGGQMYQGLNLLQIRPIRSVVLWPGFPYIFQGMTLAIFVTLTVAGWGHLVAFHGMACCVIWAYLVYGVSA